ncbi:MAG: hypothetical protein WBV80_24500 [Mycobacterium sp.]
MILAGAAAVGALMSAAATPSARADDLGDLVAATAAASTTDTPGEVLGQANQDLSQAVLLLTQVPQSSLDPDQLGQLTNQESLIYNGEGLVSQLESMQADLPAADQAGLADVDEGILQADQQLLEATQAFISVDGFSSSGTAALTAQLDWSEAAFGMLGADFHVLGVDLAAELLSNFGIPDIFLP